MDEILSDKIDNLLADQALIMSALALLVPPEMGQLLAERADMLRKLLEADMRDKVKAENVADQPEGKTQPA